MATRKARKQTYKHPAHYRALEKKKNSETNFGLAQAKPEGAAVPFDVVKHVENAKLRLATDDLCKATKLLAGAIKILSNIVS